MVTHVAPDWKPAACLGLRLFLWLFPCAQSPRHPLHAAAHTRPALSPHSARTRPALGLHSARTQPAGGMGCFPGASLISASVSLYLSLPSSLLLHCCTPSLV